MQFSSAAHWIWTEGEESPRNYWLRARRQFFCPEHIKRATILLTADSRYEFFVNGAWLGVGPIRAYPWAYSYDCYDVTSYLKRGEGNTLAVRVVHWGEFSFQYVRGRGGILCELLLELNDGQKIRIASDEEWQVAPEQAMISRTQRIAPQFGFEEHYDGRLEEHNWQQGGGEGDAWRPARVIGEIGMAPWTGLVPRSIPFLSRDEVYPQRVVAAELAQALPGPRWSFDVRRYVTPFPAGLGAEAPGTAGKALVTEIIAPHDCDVNLHYVADYAWLQFACNGEKFKGKQFKLRAGRNLFVAAGSAEWPTLHFETDVPLQFEAARIVDEDNGEGSPVWAYLAPFNEKGDTFARLYAAHTPAELPAIERYAIYAHDNLAPDIFLLTRTQHFSLPQTGFCDVAIDRPQPRTRVVVQQSRLIEEPSAMLHNNGDATTIYPQSEGDIHLVIEFEKLLIGYLAFTIDAPEGTIIDANMFEVVDDSGIFWTNLVHNSLRYTCREGMQTFRSTVRRGFRYVALTIRGASRPVKIQSVRCIFSTYPVEKRGSFVSSDALLNKIWEVSAYTVQLCMEDTYTDCPTYEQIFYVGDARNSALINAYNFGAYALTEHCLRLTAQSLSPQLDAFKKPADKGTLHLTTGHVASGWFNVITMWTMMWIWNVWEHYQITGDRQTLADLYPDVRECLRRCQLALTERDLLNVPDADNLVDWTPMDTPRNIETTSNSVLLVESLRKAALMAGALAEQVGDSEQGERLDGEARYYRALAERVREAVNRYCWSEERGAYVDAVRDEVAYRHYTARMYVRQEEPEPYETFLERGRISQPTNTLALLCKCAPQERIDRIMPLVLAAEHEDFVNVEPNWKPGWTADKLVPVGSPWFLFFTAETLVAYDHRDVAINMIRKQWGYMLSKGSTTFWEMFRFWTEEHWTRSLCHGWAGGPAYFLPTQILGVQPVEPGFRYISIAPYIHDLAWANGTTPTPHGDVHVRWAREGEAWQIEVALPQGIPGEIRGSETNVPITHLADAVGEIEQDEQGWRIRLAVGARSSYRIG